MTTEERLRAALLAADRYRPSPDLWARVAGSIEEDRRHRRRVARVLGVIAGVLLAVVVAGVAARVATRDGVAVDWRVLEGLEVVVLVTLIAGLGPALRRFGRTFVADVFRASPSTGRNFLLLLDIAFYLVAAGYVLVTVQLGQTGASDPDALASQLGGAAQRIGGVLLVMGVLHVATLIALPMLGPVFTSGWYRGDGRERLTPVAVLVVAVVAIAAVLVGVAFVLIGVGGV